MFVGPPIGDIEKGLSAADFKSSATVSFKSRDAFSQAEFPRFNKLTCTSGSVLNHVHVTAGVNEIAEPFLYGNADNFGHTGRRWLHYHLYRKPIDRLRPASHSCLSWHPNPQRPCDNASFRRRLWWKSIS